MADVTITISVASVGYTAWLRTSYVSLGLPGDDKSAILKDTELGTDQEDALANFLEEASRELLKVFLSRQGDVAGVPFEYDATNVIYRFNEETPVLTQAVAIKESLSEDVKNALYTWVTFLWFKLHGNADQTAMLLERYRRLTRNIDIHLYKLHD